MSSQQVLSTWGGESSLLTAKRVANSAESWAEEHIDGIIGAGENTDPATGETAYSSVVIWSIGVLEITSTITSYVSQADLASLVTAFKARVEANGGTVISG